MNLNLIKKITKYFFIGAILVVGVFLSKKIYRSTSRSDNTLVVGMMSGWAPFMTINAQGEFEGFDVDVASEVVKRMNKNLVINDVGSLAPCFIALDQGKVDMILSDLDITQARLKKILMVPYTGQDVKNFCLVFWQNVPAQIKSLDDLQKFEQAEVCAEPGSAQEKFLDQFSFIKQKSISRIDDMIMEIKYGKSFAAFVEPGVAKRWSAKFPEVKIVNISLPKEFRTFGIGIALSKNNKKTFDVVSKIIKQMREDGTLRMLENKWGFGAGK